MRQLLWNGLAGAGLLLLALNGNAQVRDRDGGYYGRDYGYREETRFPMERVISDLNRAESNSRLDRGDWKRFDRARKEIADFQRTWSAGRFNRHELDQAIASMQRVVDARSLNYRDRAVLVDDLNRMREFRANSRGNYSYGYRR
jgi:hypothetical protein